MKSPVYKILASTIDARENCRKSGNTEWFERHSDTIDEIMKTAPSGSGIDSGTKIDMERSTGDKLIFTFGYHHMDESGYYVEWTDHVLTVRPSLQFGIDLKISGRDRNDIKEMLYEEYTDWLKEVVEY